MEQLAMMMMRKETTDEIGLTRIESCAPRPSWEEFDPWDSQEWLGYH